MLNQYYIVCTLATGLAGLAQPPAVPTWGQLAPSWGHLAPSCGLLEFVDGPGLSTGRESVGLSTGRGSDALEQLSAPVALDSALDSALSGSTASLTPWSSCQPQLPWTQHWTHSLCTQAGVQHDCPAWAAIESALDWASCHESYSCAMCTIVSMGVSQLLVKAQPGIHLGQKQSTWTFYALQLHSQFSILMLTNQAELSSENSCEIWNQIYTTSASATCAAGSLAG